MENLCEKYLELISAFVDGELSAEEAAELQKHLESCPDCRARLKTLQEIHAVSAELLLDVPDGFSARVMSSIKASKKAEKRFALSRFKFTAIAAAIVLLILAAGRLESFAPWLAESEADAAADKAVQENSKEVELVPAALSPLNDAADVQKSSEAPEENIAADMASAKSEKNTQSSARTQSAQSAPAAAPKQESASAKIPAEQAPSQPVNPPAPEAAADSSAATEPTVPETETAQPADNSTAGAENTSDTGSFSNMASVSSGAGSDVSGGSSSDSSFSDSPSSAGSSAAAGGGAAAGGSLTAGDSSTSQPDTGSAETEELPSVPAGENGFEEEISEDAAQEDTSSSTSSMPPMPAIPQTEAYAFCIVAEGSDALALFAEYPSKIFEGNYIISFDKADKSKILSKLKESGTLFYEYTGDAQASNGLIVIVSK